MTPGRDGEQEVPLVLTLHWYGKPEYEEKLVADLRKLLTLHGFRHEIEIEEFMLGDEISEVSAAIESHLAAIDEERRRKPDCSEKYAIDIWQTKQEAGSSPGIGEWRWELLYRRAGMTDFQVVESGVEHYQHSAIAAAKKAKNDRVASLQLKRSTKERLELDG